MLCAFGRQRINVGSPTKKPRKEADAQSLTPEEEETLNSQLDLLYSALPRRTHSLVAERVLGGGANGIAYVDSPRHSLASEGGVTVFLKGDLQRADDGLTDAEFVLEEYKKWHPADSSAAEKLCILKGRFAFVLYDRSLGLIMAARDVKGQESLYWGTTMLGEGLLFASDLGFIEKECADADYYPAGALFVSALGDTMGTITSLRYTTSASDAEGDSVCRSASHSSLKDLGDRTPSQNHIAAN